jgi:hypothetical protein
MKEETQVSDSQRVRGNRGWKSRMLAKGELCPGG